MCLSVFSLIIDFVHDVIINKGFHSDQREKQMLLSSIAEYTNKSTLEMVVKGGLWLEIWV